MGEMGKMPQMPKPKMMTEKDMKKMMRDMEKKHK